MYDIHTHILPSLDDGAKALEESLSMASTAFEQGTSLMVCTPHRRDVSEKSSVHDVQILVEKVNEELNMHGIGVNLVVGMENHLDIKLPDDMLDGKALSLNNTRYSLVELPFFGRPKYIEAVLARLQMQGFVPVLAHPERIEAIQNNPDMLVELIGMGMLSQLTAGSLVGTFGHKIKTFSQDLLRRGLVHILASDAHSPSGLRSPSLLAGVEEATNIIGKTKAMSMVVDTPKAIISDQLIRVDQSGLYITPES